jgi:hypothetical protein
MSRRKTGKIGTTALLLYLISSLLGDFVLFQFDFFCSCVHTCNRSRLATSMRASIPVRSVSHTIARSTRTDLWSTLCLTRKQAASHTSQSVIKLWRCRWLRELTVRRILAQSATKLSALMGPEASSDHHRAHKSPPLHPITSNFTQLAIFIYNLCTSRFVIVLPSTSGTPKWLV